MRGTQERPGPVGFVGPRADQAKGVDAHSLWLPVVSAACFLMALVCSESMHFRAFWPELLAVVSLGTLLTALVRDVSEGLRGRQSGAEGM